MSELNIYLFRYAFFLAYVMLFLGCAVSIYSVCTDFQGFRRVLFVTIVVLMLALAVSNFYYDFFK